MPVRGRLVEDPLWYKDAVIYEVRVRAFYDSDGDGVGDFRGLTEKLDYLKDLGVNALWLLPFYPSPLRDDGYDISDYTGIHPEVGTLEDFKHFMRAAHERGLRVITELVINHTSDLHPLFQRARRSPPGSRHRDYYVWSDTPERYKEARIIFQDFERSNWTWDPVAHAYYWHRFYSHQPDLNFESPDVRRFVMQVLDFWMRMGVDGVRLDAIPYLYERDGTNCENLAETHGFLKELRRHIDQRWRHRMLLSEANQWPEDAVAYFGDADESHMAFHFPIMPRMFMAIRMEDRFPIIEIVSQTPAIPESCQWALFLRNHDELTLEMVTDEERDYMYRFYAQDPQARINLGIRRRLAPLMQNDRRRIELMNALLFSLPGTPVVYYGDEIGMGDNIYLGDRNGVRTPMQWSPDRNAGFSRANPQKLYLPINVDPEYHYETVNVETQQANPTSLLRWTRRIVRLREQYRAFGRGSIEFLYPDNPRVLAFLRRWQDETVLVVANLSRSSQFVELDLRSFEGATPVEMFGQTRFPRIGALPYFVTLGPHGFFWFALELPRSVGALTVERPLPPLAIKRRWDELLRPDGAGRADLEAAIASWLSARRRLASEAHLVRHAHIVETATLAEGDDALAVALMEVEYGDGSRETHVVPLAAASGDAAARLLERQTSNVIARLERDGAAAGIVYDPSGDPRWASILLKLAARPRRLKGEAGEFVFSRLPGAPQLEKETLDPQAIEVLRDERPWASVALGGKVVVKTFRLLEDEVNSDLETSRFLWEKTQFRHLAPPAAVLEYRRGRGEPRCVAIARPLVPSKGDAWQHTLAAAERYFAAVEALPQKAPPPPEQRPLLELAQAEPPALIKDLMGGYLEMASKLGQRTGELQLAFASHPDDPCFGPEVFSALFRRSRYQSMRNRIRKVFQTLREHRHGLPEPLRAEADRVLALEERALRYCKIFQDAKIMGKRIRIHGRLLLREVLWTGDDIHLIDGGGDPEAPMSERRNKRSPMRDVVGMLRSFRYAAFCTLLVPRAGGHLSPTAIGALEPWAAHWHTWASAAFLKAYLPVASQGGFLPTEPAQMRALLDTYLLEEMVIGLGYEMAHRPDWVRIPLHAIGQILG